MGDARVAGAARGARGAPAARLDARAGTAPRSTASATSTSLFLGSHSDRRARHLSGYAQSLWRWRSHLILSDNGRPNHDAGPDFVVEDDKRDLLARTKVLLNLHSSDLPYLEGLRLVDAIHCGAVVVSEHSAYTAPFAPGRRLLERPARRT